MTLINTPGTGLDRRTGKVISGWSHVVQSLDTLWSTQFGERVMREDYSGIVPHMLGRNMLPATVLRFKMAIWLATVGARLPDATVSPKVLEAESSDGSLAVTFTCRAPTSPAAGVPEKTPLVKCSHEGSADPFASVAA